MLKKTTLKKYTPGTKEPTYQLPGNKKLKKMSPGNKEPDYTIWGGRAIKF
jgi:hypothetical protein